MFKHFHLQLPRIEEKCAPLGKRILFIKNAPFKRIFRINCFSSIIFIIFLTTEKICLIFPPSSYLPSGLSLAPLIISCLFHFPVVYAEYNPESVFLLMDCCIASMGKFSCSSV